MLAVRLLQEEAGVRSPMRVVPLFGTLDDLVSSTDIMRRLWSMPWYQGDTNKVSCDAKRDTCVSQDSSVPLQEPSHDLLNRSAIKLRSSSSSCFRACASRHLFGTRVLTLA